jgi:Uma2 family endonuclease
MWLMRVLGDYVECGELGVIVPALLVRLRECRCGRSPDILFLATAHRHRIRPAFIEGPVDLAVEIVSPESVERDTVTKPAEYAAGGVREYWLIDPSERTVVFYQLDDGRYRLGEIDADGIYRSAAIPGFWLRVRWLWARPLPPLAAIRREYGVG